MVDTVSVIMPVLNESRHLQAAVAAIFKQDYSKIKEIILAIGPSSDDTQQIAEKLARSDSRIVLVPNPTGRTPDGLNAAIAVATGDVIVRCDGHAELPASYVSTAVRVLHETAADNVGGIMDAQGVTDFEQAVAFAMKSKFGVGAAAFHVGGSAGLAETVYLGCFKKSALRRVGGYDPKMTRAQDWEMNHRIRETGGKIWFTPELKVTYRPRPNFAKLMKQYYQYGQWRREVMRMHPRTVSGLSGLRYLIPPVTVVSNLIGLLAVLGGFINPMIWLFAAGLVTYLLSVKIVSATSIRALPWNSIWRLPLVFMAMHHAWGIGFISGIRND
jgi:glycosyltransferase involved in cell wall biosynthesis